jgi:RHS repeat-associated protein
VATAIFLVSNQTGVQGVYGSTGTSLEQAQYSTFGKQTIVGSNVTPFGFQGSYTDSTGLIYLINRYYDPSTDQFLSIDPDVATTDQPYVFTNDDPLNGTDPMGLCWICSVFDSAVHGVSEVVLPINQIVEMGTFVRSNWLGFAGLTLDGVSTGLDAYGAVSDNPVASGSGAVVGFAGTGVSQIGCDRGSTLACISRNIGAATTTAGIVETVLELSSSGPAAASLLKGAGLTLGGATATVDLAAIVVAIDNAVKAAAKKVAKKVTK